ncbi:hypothetical protein GCM10007854_28220 [Algimonas porphyrae]|uniref:Uncharacterized protein n=1 Tax=Algimonas porphyrae TaxID=1128113 RepID=A0ABQ5V487_9PROT|nr:hypothetical protein GCM10007854_28220 [Algimonas porphyrae]
MSVNPSMSLLGVPYARGIMDSQAILSAHQQDRNPVFAPCDTVSWQWGVPPLYPAACQNWQRHSGWPARETL